MIRFIFALSVLVSLCGCVPNTAYRLKRPTYDFHFPSDPDHYFLKASAGLAFIEFDNKGKLFSSTEVTAALSEIEKYKAQSTGGDDALVVVFIHGWKNNASDESGNVWGFRRVLDEIAYLSPGRSVMGIYIGWPGVGFPGQNSGFLENLSFSDRETVANTVGNGDLRSTLVQIMQATKGKDYQGSSSCILIGHSFGGLVLETAITPVLQNQIKQHPPKQNIPSPADLIVLLNEAAPAGLAVPFLKYLTTNKVTYQDESGIDRPLLLSITSSGDIDTKFAFPGGQFISPHRPPNKKRPVDEFGIDSDLTYWLLTTANTVALQNHGFDPRKPPSAPPPENAYLSVQVAPKITFDFVPAHAPNPILNKTPYWVSQLPELFVPDHGTVFGCNFMYLLLSLLERGEILPTGATKTLAIRTCLVAPGNPAELLAERATPSSVSPPPSRRHVWLEREH